MPEKIRKFPSAKIIVGLLAVALLGVVYFLFNPLEAKWMPKCMLYVLTGWECPGCGSQRAIHALLHGDLREAFHANALLVVLLPILFFLALTELQSNRFPRLFKAFHRPATIITLAVVILAWGVVRNFI